MAFFRKPFHKYGAQRTNRGDRSFASKLEASLFDMLSLMERAREITDLRCQPHVFLTRARIEMIPDFSAIDLGNGLLVFYEAKGLETGEWRIKRKLWKNGYGPGRLYVYKGSHKSLFLSETIDPCFPKEVVSE